LSTVYDTNRVQEEEEEEEEEDIRWVGRLVACGWASTNRMM
jgi:hypothetical protein